MTEQSCKRTIKKYANRRLYDTRTSKHITVDRIRQLVIDGEDVQIIDDSSGKDITSQLLLQIIAEQEQSDLPLLGPDLLQGIIRCYGHPMQEMMGHYLTRSMETYLTQQQSIQQQMASLLQPEAATEALRLLTKKNLEAWQSKQQTQRSGSLDLQTGEATNNNGDAAA
jgi:polyhydroxyalkanoate synthesis repressor PhaR